MKVWHVEQSITSVRPFTSSAQEWLHKVPLHGFCAKESDRIWEKQDDATAVESTANVDAVSKQELNLPDDSYPFGVLGIYTYQFRPAVKDKNVSLAKDLNPSQEHQSKERPCLSISPQS